MNSFEAFCAYLASKLDRVNGLQPLESAVPTTTFDELGFDSLHLVEAAMVTEELFDVNISDKEVEDCTTIGDLYNHAVRLATRNVA
jgi:acyl carrier protein